MNQKSKFQYLNTSYRQIFVKLISYLIKSKKHGFVEPVGIEEIDEADEVNDGHAIGVHEADRDEQVHLCVFFTTFDLGAGVELLEVFLCFLAGVWDVGVSF